MQFYSLIVPAVWLYTALSASAAAAAPYTFTPISLMT